MHNRTAIEKILHFSVHNSFLITVAVMCFVHAVLLGLMWYANVTTLMNFNVLSVIVYLFCIVLCRIGHIMPVFVSIILEVSLYSVVSVYSIGWDSCAYCFLFSIIPITIYFGCFLFKGSERWLIVALMIMNFTVFIILYFKYSGAVPVYRMAYWPKSFHIIFANFAMVFAIIFYNTVYIYASEFELNRLEQTNEQLSSDVQNDELTGLLNRRGFLPLIGELMNEDHSNHFCISFCDIDNFKRINDNYGHECGDEVLSHISGVIKKEMQGCAICRWGGEEIIILMKDYDLAVARQKMEYLRKSIETSPTVFFNKRIPATITIGLEEYSDSYSEPEEIIRAADGRMYYGKQHGKNIVISEDAA